MNALTMPGGMLSPFTFEATCPRVDSAARIIRVVVDLPFVPVTVTQRHPRDTSERTFGASARATLPPIIPPEPRPRAREAVRARDPNPVATRERRDRDEFDDGRVES